MSRGAMSRAAMPSGAPPGGRRKVVNTTRIVREKPVVIVHRRVVDDPPLPPKRRGLLMRRVRRGPPRVIRAEAEITILGPDRMSIRLYRKRGAAEGAFGKQ